MDTVDPIKLWNDQAAEFGMDQEIKTLGKEDMNRLEARLRRGEDIKSAMAEIMTKRIQNQGMGFVEANLRREHAGKLAAFRKAQSDEFQAFQTQSAAELEAEIQRRRGGGV